MRSIEFLNEVSLYTAGMSAGMLRTQMRYFNDHPEYETIRGKVDNLQLSIIDDGGHKSYLLREPTSNNVVAFLTLEYFRTWKAMEESLVWSAPEYRGRGLVSELYDTFIKSDNGILISDNLHSDSAISMWKGFVKRKQYKIYAVDLSNTQNKAHVYWDNAMDDFDFVSSGKGIPEIWDDPEGHDVRLIAHK